VTPADLIKAFETLADAPEGIARLRELVLQLAVRGKLVPQDLEDEPAGVLLERIAAEKARLVEKKVMKRKKPPPLPTSCEVPFELPASWSWVRLTDIAGYNIREKVDPTRIGSDAWLLDLADIEKTTSRLLVRGHYGDRISKSTKSAFCKGDVLYGKLRPYLDKVIVADQDGYCTTEVVPVVPFLGMLASFLRWSLKRPDFLAYVNELSYGMKMPRLGTGDAEKSLHPLPPTKEQHRIVARVDELMVLLDRLEAAREAWDTTRAAARDAALAALRDADTPEEVEAAWGRLAKRMDDLLTAPADVEPLRQTVLQLAVRGRLVPQDPNDEPASVLLERIAEDKARLVKEKKIRRRKPATSIDAEDAPFDLPVGWCWARLGSALLDITAGWSPSAQNRPKTGTEWGVLKVSACSWGKFLPDENKALAPGTEPRTELEVASGDFLISRANTLELVARSVVVEDAPPHLMLSDKTLRLTPGSGIYVPYLNLANLSVHTREHYARNASGTSASMRNVSQEAIWQAPIPMAPLAEQHRIVAKVDELMTIIDRLTERLTATRETQAAFAAAAVHHLEA